MLNFSSIDVRSARSKALRLALLASVASCAIAAPAIAGDATWSATPGSGDFNTAGNWTPTGVPTGVATFGTSTNTTLSVSVATTLDGLTFNTAPYTIENLNSLTLNGVGIVTTMGGSVTIHNDNTAQGKLNFTGTSTAGSATINNDFALDFKGSSTAGHAIINSTVDLGFSDSSSAGNATIVNSKPGASGGTMNFYNTSSAGNATITNNALASLSFNNSSTAGTATITNNSKINFAGNSTGGNATIINNTPGSIEFAGTSGTNGDHKISVGSIDGSGRVSLGDNELTIGSNDRSTELSGTVSGTNGAGGSLVKVGTGTLTLSGVRKTVGSTRIEAGTLQLGKVGAQGLLIGTVTVNTGGTFDIVNSEMSTITIVNAATTNFRNTSSAGDATITNSGDLAFFDSSTAGTASITNTGTGNITFSGESSGGAAAFDNAVAAVVDFSGATGVSNNHKLTAGSIAGAGAYKLGANELTVGSNNRSTTVSGVISGTGSLVKTGGATLTLSGVNTYSGATSILNGVLAVNGDISASSGVTASTGSTLRGNGILGATTIAVGGIHAPGDGIGTQTVAGNYVNHGTLQIEATPTSADKLIVNGTVDVSGATLSLLLTPTTAASWDIAHSPFTYTIIDNNGSDTVTGHFATTNDFNHLLFLDASVDYAGGNGNDVTLSLARNDIGFGSVVGTPNQSGVAQAVESLGSGPLYDAIVTMTDPDLVQKSFDALSGEINASARSTLVNSGQQLGSSVNDRLMGAFDDTSGSAPVLAYGEDGPELAPSDTKLMVAWGGAFGGWGDIDGDGNAAGLKTGGGGLVGGIDSQFGDWRLGLLAGYSRSGFNAADRASSGTTDSYSLGVYGGTQWGNLVVRSGLTASAHGLGTSRDVVIPGFVDHLSAAYDARSLQAYGEVGYRFEVTNAMTLEPYANLTQVRLDTDGYSETGGAAALTSSAATANSTFTTIGMRASQQFAMGTVLGTVRAAAGWRHGFGDLIPTSTMAFAGGTPFTVTGTPSAADTALVSAGLDLNLNENTTVGLTYDGRFAKGSKDNGASAKLEVRF